MWLIVTSNKILTMKNSIILIVVFILSILVFSGCSSDDSPNCTTCNMEGRWHRYFGFTNDQGESFILTGSSSIADRQFHADNVNNLINSNISRLNFSPDNTYELRDCQVYEFTGVNYFSYNMVNNCQNMDLRSAILPNGPLAASWIVKEYGTNFAKIEDEFYVKIQ